MLNRFSRTELLLGSDAIDRLSKSRVAVFGIGGVGGYAVEALARSGVGQIDLIDNDTVSITNINRQIIALDSTVGKYKVDAAEERIKLINSDCRVNKYKVFYSEETAGEFDLAKYDYIIDAIDTVSSKILLAVEAQKAEVPIISSMGAGNKIDPTAFEIADIYQTSVCPLARVMRRELKKRGIKKLKVVYSKEPPLKPAEDCSDLQEMSQENPVRRSLPGSIAFAPAAAGLAAAAEVICRLCGVRS